MLQQFFSLALPVPLRFFCDLAIGVGDHLAGLLKHVYQRLVQLPCYRHSFPLQQSVIAIEIALDGQPAGWIRTQT